ncbi:ATP-binding protein [Desulfococcaceae bacterium HSG9]|nr:ATP-binding protein [Desulfococcaceae bacterium HSG9]
MIDHEIINTYFGSLDYMPVGAFVLRKDYVVLFWNRCLENWTGIDKKKIVGTNIADCFPHFKEPRYTARLESIFQGGPPMVFSSQLHKHLIFSTLPSGQLRTNHTIVTARREIGGDKFYAIFSIQDVTDMSRRVRDYAVLSKKLKETNAELEAFTYSVSHDLRAPLRAMIGFSRILMEKFADDLPDKARLYLKTIKDSSLELGNLIDDLLRLSRINRADIQRETINIKQLVEDVFEKIAYKYKDRDIELNIGDLPECHSDPILLKQVVTNLLSNAIKYTRCREIARIEIGSEPSDKEPIYYVKDNGVGFDMRYADELFDVFQRLHQSEEYEGTGVGLAIVKRIVNRHGGNVWAQGKIDEGATFYFTLGEAPVN